MDSRYALDLHLGALVGALANVDTRTINPAVSILRAARASGALVMVAGNGGSAANAAHFAADLQAVGVRAVCLADSAPRLTALANDDDYAAVFALQLEVMARPGDVLVLLSCSGTSPNVAACGWWAQHGPVIAVYGEHGRDAARSATCAIVVPSEDYEVVEDVASAICHAIKKALRDG
jgi:phosphoheptose isomerase